MNELMKNNYLFASWTLLFHFSMVFSVEYKEWTYFVFVQQWPPAACLEVPHNKCLIQKDVIDWSIHGLWPTADHGYPSFCNKSWPFKPELLKPILLALEEKWPNIYADTSDTSFWKHEWTKHGTCAASLAKFNNELKYFTNCLHLHDQYNIFEFLRKAGINPNGNKPYMLKYVENAILLQVHNSVKLFCRDHKEFSSPVLTSIYICMDKNLNLIDCDKIIKPTCQKTYVYYLPFNRTTKN